MVLYNDRVFSFEQLAHMEPVVRREAPDDETLGRFIDLDIRNQLAFMELEHYQKTGRFLYEHPLTKMRKQHNELEALRKSNPERFASELINADKSITRYRSYVENKKYKSPKEKLSWQHLIEVYSQKKEIMQKLLAGS